MNNQELVFPAACALAGRDEATRNESLKGVATVWTACGASKQF